MTILDSIEKFHNCGSVEKLHGVVKFHECGKFSRVQKSSATVEMFRIIQRKG